MLKYKKEPSLKGFGSLFAGGLFNRGIGSIRLLIFAPLLGPAAFGALRLASVISVILSSITGLGLFNSYPRYLPEISSKNESYIFIKKTLLFSVLSASIAACILIFLPQYFSKILFASSDYAVLTILVGLSIPFTVIFKSIISALVGFGKFRQSAINESIHNFVYLILGLLLMILISRSSELVFSSYIIGLLIAIIWIIPKIKSTEYTKADEKKSDEYFQRALKYSLWYSLIPIFQYLFDFIDRWMLAHYYNLETVGAYSIIPLLTSGMFLISSSLAPIVARKGTILFSRGLLTSAQNIIWSCVKLAVLASLIYSIGLRLVEPIIWEIAGETWGQAASVLPVFLAYNTIFNVYYISGSFVGIYEKTYVHLIGLIAGAVTNIILNLLLIKPYGIFGASFGTLGGIIVTVLVYIIFMQFVRIKISFRNFMILLIPIIFILPKLWFIILSVVILFFSLKTNLILNDSDKRMAYTWIYRTTRNFKRREAL